MSKWLLLRVDILKDYEDVHPDLIFEDFLTNTRAWKATVISVEQEPPQYEYGDCGDPMCRGDCIIGTKE